MNWLTALSVPVALALLLGVAAPGAGLADDKEKEEMQKELNQQVLGQPFSVEDVAKIDAYVEDALKKGIKPQETPPAWWRPGYTCDDVLVHANGYYWYRDCRYYYRYYGHYW